MAFEGKEGTGCSKSCAGFQPPRTGDVNKKTKCQRCSHRKKIHRDPTVQEVLARYGVDRLSNSKPPITDFDARKETNAGFRTKKESGGVSASSAKKTNKNKKRVSEATQLVKVSSVLVITCGLDSEGELQDAKSPTPSTVEKLLKCKLVISKTRDDKELEFSLAWDQKQIDKWFRMLFPILFEYLEYRYPGDRDHWVLLGKDQRKLFVMDRASITGAELDESKGPANRKFTDHVLRIATKHHIPWRHCKDLEDVIERCRGGEETGSESEIEPAKRRKSNPKARAVKGRSDVKAEPSEGSDSAVDSESDELEEPDEVDARPITRRSVSRAAVKPEEQYLRPYDSGDDDTFPPAHEALFGKASSLKRSASPGFLLLDDVERGRKRARATSHDHISIASTSDEKEESMSPHLRPATSSFQYDPAVSGVSGTDTYSTWTPTWASSAVASVGIDTVTV
ncbi:hypothetical protein B0H10DRAFT_2213621 [Mycena sp. CBHHK59/15]|nr:hypothetical protein B0H10DRAFT_2213621 [Mycena sp. CBHHK59/15]